MNDQIEAAARNSYVFKIFLKGADLQIFSQDGVVTLKGAVAKESKKKGRTAEEFIDDASIKARIKWAITLCRGTSPFRVAVAVTRDVVSIDNHMIIN